VGSVTQSAAGVTESLAFIARLDEYGPRVLALARSLRLTDPEDLVQATFEIAIRKSSQLRDESAVWPYLLELFRGSGASNW
jgi:DNA-directed RNA polymerase specialized sigma24 family protein